MKNSVTQQMNVTLAVDKSHESSLDPGGSTTNARPSSLDNKVVTYDESKLKLTKEELSMHQKRLDLFQNTWSTSWAKKILKLYKALTYFEKQKNSEPLMSKAFKEFAKQLHK